MRPYVVVIFHVRQQYMTEVSLAVHNNVVKALPSDRTDQPFNRLASQWFQELHAKCRCPPDASPFAEAQLTEQKTSPVISRRATPKCIRGCGWIGSLRYET